MAVGREHIYRKRDRLRQLRAFCLAADLKSFTRAAERLDLSQSAVSLHVRELENELQSLLFHRSGAGITLTAAGERLFEFAAPLVDGFDNLPADLMVRIDEIEPGRLHIAASAAGAAIVLPPYIKRLRDEHPDVRLRVRNCLLSEGIVLLLKGEVEFVLGPRDLYPNDSVEYRELLRYDIVLITSLDHPLAGRATVSPEEAGAWRAIVPPTGAYSTQFGETAAEQFGVHANAVIEVGGWGVIKRYVENGLGIAVVPSVSINETDQVSVIPLREYFASRSFGVYTRRRRFLSPPARRLLLLMGQDFPRPPRPSFGPG